MNKKKMNFVDLFCGGGGFTCGFVQAGFEPILAIDKDKWSCLTHQFNFPKCRICQKDIADFDEKLSKIDVVIGSPPCKEFSVGNVNRTFDDSLVMEFFRIVDTVKPKYWVMENVVGVERVLPSNCHKTIFEAHNFGCATVRKRLFATNFNLDGIKTSPPKSVKDVINIRAPRFRQPYKNDVYRKINVDKPYVTLVEQRICNERYLLPNGGGWVFPRWP